MLNLSVPVEAVAGADYAEAAATVLTLDNQAGRVYELAGDTSYTLAELVADLDSGDLLPAYLP